ncbi:MAG TPA: Cro/CI family transcriptional regulator [Gammaproteobacteria bacterium]|nr:Cro/CI family transcriptional regulator [Gammaproteobacteria bacterium]
MSQRLSKQEAIALFPTAKALATALGVSKSAVSQWPDGPIPENHDLKIRYELKPEHFRARRVQAKHGFAPPSDGPGLPPQPARTTGTAVRR